MNNERYAAAEKRLWGNPNSHRRCQAQTHRGRQCLHKNQRNNNLCVRHERISARWFAELESEE